VVKAEIREHVHRETADEPGLCLGFAGRFMFLMAYAILTTYEAYYLLQKLGSAVAEVPQQIFLGTLVQSVVIVAASLIAGNLSGRTGRRKVFVFTASIGYGLAIFVIAIASNFKGFSSAWPSAHSASTPAPFPSPSRRRGRQPSWRSAAAVRLRSMPWPGVSDRRCRRHPAGEGGPLSRTRYRRAASRRHRIRRPGSPYDSTYICGLMVTTWCIGPTAPEPSSRTSSIADIQPLVPARENSVERHEYHVRKPSQSAAVHVWRIGYRLALGVRSP
jgi:hypothetical protein